MNQTTQAHIAKLDPQVREYFNERVEILESVNVPRGDAENAAWKETAAAMLRRQQRKAV